LAPVVTCGQRDFEAFDLGTRGDVFGIALDALHHEGHGSENECNDEQDDHHFEQGEAVFGRGAEVFHDH